jgi:transcriptional regulator with XRE-family HTH domain
MRIQGLSQRILAKAAHKLGGVGPLASHLGVGEATLAEWLSGRDIPAAEIILQAVGVLVDEPITSWRSAPTNDRTVDSGVAD